MPRVPSRRRSARALAPGRAPDVRLAARPCDEVLKKPAAGQVRDHTHRPLALRWAEHRAIVTASASMMRRDADSLLRACLCLGLAGDARSGGISMDGSCRIASRSARRRCGPRLAERREVWVLGGHDDGLALLELGRERLAVGLGAGLVAAGGFGVSQPPSSVSGAPGSAERSGEISAFGLRRRSSVSAARARCRVPAVVCSHALRSVMSFSSRPARRSYQVPRRCGATPRCARAAPPSPCRP